LHGSLLPKYRGAAPINWAVINGETETGVTTFFIEKEIDTGKVIDHAKIDIQKYDTAGDVHDRLMWVGADLLVHTIQRIFANQAEAKVQPESEVSHAPKIFKPDCKIDWHDDALAIFNKIRGLSPYPTAFTTIRRGDELKSLKLFEADYTIDHANHVGQLKQVGSELWLGCQNGWIKIMTLQLEGKKRMKSEDFLKGFKMEGWQPE